MRTTLDIADDVLFAVKDFARRDKKTTGQVISEWGRTALQNPAVSQKAISAKAKSKQDLSDEDRGFMTLGLELFPTATATKKVFKGWLPCLTSVF